MVTKDREVPMLRAADERAEYQRSVQVIVYSMNGGPIPTRAVERLKREAQEIAQSFPAVAITVVEE